MTQYIIGDVHGCFDGLMELLTKINYNKNKDELFFTGDLINRGPKNIEVLEYIYNNENAELVLGNHDLHLLALEVNPNFKHYNGLKEVVMHPKFKIWRDWLRSRPLIHKHKDILLVHAGIYPLWSENEALDYAKEVGEILQSDNYKDFLSNMYGNMPNKWQKNLSGWDRYRFITNACTRMRYLTKDHLCDFEHSMHPKEKPKNLSPWYETANYNSTIAFGHWASLKAMHIKPNIIALDGGYVWGGKLIAWNTETSAKSSIKNQKNSKKS